jgi:hypothetical protein
MANLDLDSLPKKGEAVIFNHRGASIQMIVENARIRYGQVDVLLSPVAGSGTFWVTYASVKTSNDTNAPTPVEKALNS